MHKYKRDIIYKYDMMDRYNRRFFCHKKKSLARNRNSRFLFNFINAQTVQFNREFKAKNTKKKIFI